MWEQQQGLPPSTNNGPTTTVGIGGGRQRPGRPSVAARSYGLEADTSGGWCLAKAQLAIGGIQVARAIYDTLTMPGADGKIHPYLAQSVTGNANNTVWTIKLRPDIKFSDGSALDRPGRSRTTSTHYRSGLPVRSRCCSRSCSATSSAVNVVNPLTVAVTTKARGPAFPWFLWRAAASASWPRRR